MRRTEDGARGIARRAARHARRPVVLAALTALLGGAGLWAQQQAAALGDEPAARNTALTDNARTSEVKGAVTEAVNGAFSYTYADPAKSEAAARGALTGPAVGQHAAMFAGVRKEGPAQRLVLTTTVTDGAVTLLTGDRARLLLFADQRNTRATDGRGVSAPTMLAVDAVRRDGRWKISGIDAFTGR
ncbi:hypothetical protein ACIBF1_25695 [Spirillospora sp. NPDC050679]